MTVKIKEDPAFQGNNTVLMIEYDFERDTFQYSMMRKTKVVAKWSEDKLKLEILKRINTERAKKQEGDVTNLVHPLVGQDLEAS